MCWERDYKFFAEQKKAQETRIKQERRRAGVIDRLLNEANRQGEKTAEETVKEAARAACEVGKRFQGGGGGARGTAP
jgi:hypothetical protein